VWPAGLARKCRMDPVGAFGIGQRNFRMARDPGAIGFLIE
jgi:hypothetical protein